MTLAEKLAPVGAYVVDVMIKQGYNMVKVTYPSGWIATPTDKVSVEQIPNMPSTWLYWSENSKAGVEDIVDVVADTVVANNNRMLKERLFDSKVEELRKLFDQNGYEALAGLTFVIKPEKKKRGRKTKEEEKNTGKEKKETGKIEEKK